MTSDCLLEMETANEGEVRPQRTSSLTSYLNRRNSGAKLTKRLTLTSLKSKAPPKEESIGKAQLVKIGILSKSNRLVDNRLTLS